MDIKTADRLIELRKANGYSQEALGEKLGVSRQAISKWERGESSPDTDNLISLAEIYGITLDELINPDKEINTDVKKDEEQQVEKEKAPAVYSSLGKSLFKFPFALIVVAIYVGFNLFTHNWHPSWLAFLLIPIYYHFAGACFTKSKKGFLFALPIPEIVILLYLIGGFTMGLWIKAAILFIIIPLYFWGVAFYKRK